MGARSESHALQRNTGRQLPVLHFFVFLWHMQCQREKANLPDEKLGHGVDEQMASRFALSYVQAIRQHIAVRKVPRHKSHPGVEEQGTGSCNSFLSNEVRGLNTWGRPKAFEGPRIAPRGPRAVFCMLYFEFPRNFQGGKDAVA